ncbi:MAG: hypothetical protein IPK07_32360 [Deltaproteobacteria bacterium]|nr:hypothetical protein [Deltaproteobacteria bacterium]
MFVFDLGGHLDVERLAASLELAVTRHHPVAGAQIERFGGLFYRWRCRPFEARAYLHGAYAEPRTFDLIREPPLRVHVGTGSLAFEMSHVAFDAVGFARVVRTVLEQYDAFPRILEPAVDEVRLRREGRLYAPRPADVKRNPGRRFVDPGSGRTVARSADPIVRTGIAGARGTLHHHVVLPLGVIREAARVGAVTINDWLAAAALTAYTEWNASHGSRARFASIDLPANLRPTDRSTLVAANVTGTFTLNLDLGARIGRYATFAEILAAVRTAKADADRDHRAWSMAPRWPVRTHPTEVGVWVGRALTRLMGDALLTLGPTLLLSNFGLLDGLVGRFGDLELSRLRVEGSAYPSWTLDAVSPSRSELTLSFCVRKSHFSASTLAEFAGLVEERALSPCKS